MKPRDPVVVTWLDAIFDPNEAASPDEAAPSAQKNQLTATIGFLHSITETDVIFGLDYYPASDERFFRGLHRIPIDMVVAVTPLTPKAAVPRKKLFPTATPRGRVRKGVHEGGHK